MALNTEKFIERAKSIHGDKYDYSKVSYVNCRTRVCIICPEHGEFMQVPYYHLAGNGCPKCFNEKKRGKAQQPTTEEFIEKAKKIHGDKYDYSKVNYVDAKTKVCIICPEHGEFFITPNKHLIGEGCRLCGIKRRANKRKMSCEEFIRRAKLIHGGKYDYSKVKYVNSQTKVCIICPEHGEFWQTPSSHLNGSGCQLCNEWEMEFLVKSALGESGIKFEQEKTFEWLKHINKLRLDFYLPEYNIAIECQGEQHFIPVKYWGGEETFEKIKSRDFAKKYLCEKNGISLLFFTTDKKHSKEKYFNDTQSLIRHIKEL